MKLFLALATVVMTLSSTFASSVFFEADLKQSILKNVKETPALAAEYSKKMDQAFDFLDPDDPRRMDASDINNLQDYSLSLWVPSHSFRMGQGDYELCSDSEELASSDYGTVVVGFDTSYKREEVYGFWAVYSYSYLYCEKDDQITKSKTILEFKRWLSQEQVELILY